MACESTIASAQTTSPTSERATSFVSIVPWLLLDVMPQYKRMWWIHGGRLRLLVDELWGGVSACRMSSDVTTSDK
jgi:hypothetical protein